ncbi:Ca2+-transporting ATPase [Ruminiclostridium sufflavum DSM 19573]|uniref:P-type Ca(2+) transporter n=1 Tax=Ruminiclostridium sufflavum DSM 19573 TaxID=1121337 RepID=A0A318XGV9_9FIRM|nr:calcium-translocating P-type ATPase, PMCA-type [Ruminiclostridium sufflavum]PYG83898.1 Ca2+-transporting ATPase [Ruminiclostridium sufflavum DSM 19573]
MKFYCSDREEVLKAVNSNENGLTSSESERWLVENGKNKLKEGERVTLLQRFLAQIKDPMIIILIAAAVVSGVTAAYSGEGFADVIIIMIVVIINAVLGVYQESKAEKAIEALQEMAASTSKVLRDGQMTIVKSEDIAVGDVVILEAGDAVPADGRIIENASMKVEESALTGESVPVNKIIDKLGIDGADVSLGDRKNMVYMGSTVVYGRGRAVITATGMDTEMGKIADAITKAEQGQTPLQIKLSQLSKVLSYLVVGICLFIFAFSLIRSGSFSGQVVLDTFMIAVSLAVAAIPEGLAMVVTVVLSVGVTNMSKRNAIIRRLTAVETLGCAEIICSDKTGTLTQNKMTVVEHYGEELKLLAEAMALCSDAELDSNNEATGEPTECALVNFAFKQGLAKPQLKEEAPRIGEAPFDSMRKMMSTVHETADGIVQYTKGAPDEVLKVCKTYIKNGKILPLDENAANEIKRANKAMADKALRVLGAAQRIYESEPADFEPAALEKDLTFIGLTGMIDPIRPEVKDAIAQCKSAGVTAIMITGDHRDTAVAIAQQLGILENESQAITGAQLDGISDNELEKTIADYRVYARVQPEHKVRIVNAWRKKGCITAMTGDGVNDAPSIKSADIGVGMGITGTDVTKNVADMVLADDNFATIVGAVEEGRKIYNNIRKTIQFLLASNMSEVLSIFLSTLLGFTILHPVHLLWINLITDSFPALALGMEKGDTDIMKRKPRSSKEGIFANGLGADVIYQGILVALLTVTAYFVGHRIEAGVWEIAQSADGITMAFLTLSFAEIFHSFNMRSQRGSIFKLNNQNLFLWGAGIASLIMTTLVIYVPFLANAFEFEHISSTEFAYAVLIAATIIPIVEIVKLIQRSLAKNR